MSSLRNLIPSQPQSTDEEAFLYAMQLSSFAILPMTLGAAIHLGILEIIANAGPDAYLSPSEISALLPTQNPAAAASLDRLLRLLASYSVLTCAVETGADGKVVRKYGAAPVVKFFAKNEDGVSLAPYALICQDKTKMEIWHYLKYVVLDGTIPLEKAYKKTFYELNSMDPTSGKLFDEAMRNTSVIVMKAILERYKGFDDLKLLVDVGGGIGGTLDIILKKHPHIKGVNFDLPHVISEAPVIPGVEHIAGDMFDSIPGGGDAIFLKAALLLSQIPSEIVGDHYIPNGVEHIAGDMFDSIPDGGDAIFLKWILHNWSDEHCLNILKNCYKALPDNEKVIVMEYCLPAYPEPTMAAQESISLDVIMMLVYLGKERTKEEFEFLAKEASFSRVEVGCNIYANYWMFEFYK